MEKKNLSINMILPFRPKRPTGGFRIMYEYANRLTQSGYDVRIYYPIEIPYMNYRFKSYWIRKFLTVVEGINSYNWFDLDPRIERKFIPRIKDEHIKDGDIVMATWWSASAEMGKLNAPKGKKINVIQGYENWEGNDELLYESYRMPKTTNIVISSYLKKVVDEHSTNPIFIIQNAVDTSIFYPRTPIETRNKYRISMLHSEQVIKGSKYGMEALKIIKERHPEIEVDLFGIYPKPDGLPEWIKYTREPKDLAAMHSQNAIYMGNSLTEGMALAPLESLFCGCALVCTDIPGQREYAKEGETALLVPAENPQAMADRVCYLIENDEERIALAKSAHQYVQRFSWNDTMVKLEEVFSKLV